MTPSPFTREEGFAQILKLPGAVSGVDFTHYKRSTIKRHIASRMALHNIENLGGYLKHLNDNRHELDALYHDILIHVTSFFRGRRCSWHCGIPSCLQF
jgi:two-component system, chemotaxis family, CheB/CheR fusion protein